MALPKGISDILPLSSAQTGMLFHVLERAETKGRYVAVLSCTLKGPLNPERLRHAIQVSVQNRDAYRAGFVWQGTKEPLQIIHETVELPWAYEDWQNANDIETRFHARIQEEQARPFDLARAPLMAATLIQIAPDEWRLIWTIHHLISDGWSTSVVLKEVFERYKNGGEVSADFQKNQASFKDYIVWLRKKTPAFDDTFWTKHFEGLEDASQLPVPSKLSENNPSNHERLERALGTELLYVVNQHAKTLKVTTNTILSTSWALVLRKMLNRDDVVFGQTFAGRPSQLIGSQNAAGAFINTVPIRVSIKANETVETLLKRVSDDQQNIARQQFAPLAKVIATTPIAKGTALFDTMFVNEAVAATDMTIGDIEMSDLRTVQSSNYSLTMLVTPNDDFRAELYFDPQILSRDHAEDCLNQYETLLRSIVQNPDAKIIDLAWDGVESPIVPDSRDYPNVLEKILSHADKTPDAPALTFEGSTISYQHMANRAYAVAESLKAQGVVKNDIVPVFLERSIDAIIAFLGVQMVGAAYAPMDPEYPEKRNAQILEIIAPKIVLSSTQSSENLPKSSATVLLMSDIPDKGEKCTPILGDRAYIIFTSGSEGKPKGVEITHNALAHSTGIRPEVYGEAPERFLLLSSLAFDSSVVGLYWTLSTGCHLVIAPTHIEQEPLKLGALIKAHHVTHTLCLPSLAQMLLKTLPAQYMSSLRTFILAGDILPYELIETCKATLPQCRIVNEYGPTETTVWCTFFDTSEMQSPGAVPIGKALPGTWVGICDKDFIPVKKGEIGEIIVAGPMLAKGYMGAPQKTDSAFVSIGPDALRAYRTGDLGYFSDDGLISFIGRTDQQVKVRGHRVELSEIEATARAACPDFELAAIAHQKNGRTQIILCIEHEADASLERKIRDHIIADLPAPFHPTQYIFAENFKRLPNGKLDRKALISHIDQNAPHPIEASSSDTLETRIAQLFADTLQLASVPRDGNFFDLGGDSLLTLNAYAKAQEQGIAFEPADIFDHPTPAELTNHIITSVDRPMEHQGIAEFRIAQPEATGTPVVLIHGTMQLFRQVSLGLNKKHPVALLFSHFLFGQKLSLRSSISDLADDAIKRLKQGAPTGPYIICGYSIGCVIAFEVARKLGTDTVTKLCLIDPPFLALADKAALLDDDDLAEKQKPTKRRLAVRATRHALKAPFLWVLQKLLPQSEWVRRHLVRTTYMLAMARYRVPTYSGKTQIIETAENPAMALGNTWDKQLLDKEIMRVPFQHHDLISKPESVIDVTAHIIADIK